MLLTNTFFQHQQLHCPNRPELFIAKVLESVMNSIPTFSMLVDKLEGFDESECLVDRPADRQVVDGHLPDSATRTDDEQTPEGETYFLN